jgi:hypothetical protein
MAPCQDDLAFTTQVIPSPLLLALDS